MWKLYKEHAILVNLLLYSIFWSRDGLCQPSKYKYSKAFVVKDGFVVPVDPDTDPNSLTPVIQTEPEQSRPADNQNYGQSNCWPCSNGEQNQAPNLPYCGQCNQVQEPCSPVDYQTGTSCQSCSTCPVSQCQTQCSNSAVPICPIRPPWTPQIPSCPGPVQCPLAPRCQLQQTCYQCPQQQSCNQCPPQKQCPPCQNIPKQQQVLPSWGNAPYPYQRDSPMDIPKATTHPPGYPQVFVDPVEVTVQPGSTILLHCNATGKEPLKYYWKSGKNTYIPSHVRVSHGTLIFRHVKREDVGQYYCIAWNHLGQSSAQSTIYLEKEITNIPFSVSIHHHKVVAKPGRHVTFNCTSNVTSVTFEWKRDDGLEMPRSSEVVDGLLKLYRVSKSNQGTYICIATSPSGERKIAKAYLKMKSAHHEVINIPNCKVEKGVKCYEE